MKDEDLKVGDFIYLKPKSECSGEFLSIPYFGVFDNNMHRIVNINYSERVFNVLGDDYWYHIDWVKLIVTEDVESELII